MDKLKRMLRSGDGSLGGGDADEEQGVLGEVMDASTLSWSTRIKGFAACFVLGFILSILGTIVLSLTANLKSFAVLYSLGNIVSVCSTLFLMGPMNQLKRMFASTRWIATIVMLLFLILTLVSAFVLHKKGLTIIFCLLQFIAMTWYSLSYIPYARDVVKKFFNSCVS